VDVPDEATEQFSSLNWDQILEMGENKIEFGSHTKSHFILSRLGSNDLAPEISWSKTFIEGKINKPVTSFCYPNGQPEDYSVDVVSAVRRAGYSCAVTTSVGFNKNPVDPFLLKRMWLSFKERGDLYLSKELTVPNMPSKTHLLKTYSKA